MELAQCLCLHWYPRSRAVFVRGKAVSPAHICSTNFPASRTPTAPAVYFAVGFFPNQSRLIEKRASADLALCKSVSHNISPEWDHPMTATVTMLLNSTVLLCELPAVITRSEQGLALYKIAPCHPHFCRRCGSTTYQGPVCRKHATKSLVAAIDRNKSLLLPSQPKDELKWKNE